MNKKFHIRVFGENKNAVISKKKLWGFFGRFCGHVKKVDTFSFNFIGVNLFLAFYYLVQF